MLPKLDVMAAMLLHGKATISYFHYVACDLIYLFFGIISMLISVPFSYTDYGSVPNHSLSLTVFATLQYLWCFSSNFLA